MAVEQIWGNDVVVPEGKVEMCVNDPLKGHLHIIWDPNVPAEVESVRAQFNDLKAKGFAGYSVNADGSKGEKIDSFDPKAAKMIMAQQMAGG